MDAHLLYLKFLQLPDKQQKEVEDFIDQLLSETNCMKKRVKPVFGSGKGMFACHEDFNSQDESYT